MLYCRMSFIDIGFRIRQTPVSVVKCQASPGQRGSFWVPNAPYCEFAVVKLGIGKEAGLGVQLVNFSLTLDGEPVKLRGSARGTSKLEIMARASAARMPAKSPWSLGYSADWRAFLGLTTADVGPLQKLYNTFPCTSRVNSYSVSGG